MNSHKSKERAGPTKGNEGQGGLKEGAAPIFCESRPIPFALLERIKQVIQKEVEDREIEPVEQSGWAPPIMMVKKKDGGLRV